jgi:hypothetical protein
MQAQQLLDIRTGLHIPVKVLGNIPLDQILDPDNRLRLRMECFARVSPGPRKPLDCERMFAGLAKLMAGYCPSVNRCFGPDSRASRTPAPFPFP